MPRPVSSPRWPRGPVPISTGSAEVVPDPEGPEGVTLLVNGVPSSHLDLADPTALEFEYQQQMMAVIATAPPGPIRVVHLGAGACGLALAVLAARPDSIHLAVEVDARLVELVRTWFDLPRPPRLRLRVADARAWLAGATPDVADVVVRDAFDGARVPPPLATVQAARLVRRALVAGGSYLANCADDSHTLTGARREAATLREVFRHVAVIAEPGVLRGRRYGNVVLVASDGPLPPAAARQARALPVPARVMTDDEVDAFAAGAAVLQDPA